MRVKLISMLGAAALSLTSVTAMAAETIRVTLQLPETHSLGKNWNAFKKIIEEKSNGELSFSSSRLLSCLRIRKCQKLLVLAQLKLVQHFLAASPGLFRPLRS
ncbi:hypothetical protein [Pseudovibrio denitrificans]|uniref:hypothetical protein n=1 Tax=Pseudovibrio denitrificans TaxID=258256 RepID=UPI001AD8D5C4|nr:hypothetical protein [Pseudovibrio denitrificans]